MRIILKSFLPIFHHLAFLPVLNRYPHPKENQRTSNDLGGVDLFMQENSGKERRRRRVDAKIHADCCCR